MRYPFLCQTSDGFVLLRYHCIERTIGMSRRDLLRIDPDWVEDQSPDWNRDRRGNRPCHMLRIEGAAD